MLNEKELIRLPFTIIVKLPRFSLKICRNSQHVQLELLRSNRSNSRVSKRNFYIYIMIRRSKFVQVC